MERAKPEFFSQEAIDSVFFSFNSGGLVLSLLKTGLGVISCDAIEENVKSVKNQTSMK